MVGDRDVYDPAIFVREDAEQDTRVGTSRSVRRKKSAAAICRGEVIGEERAQRLRCWFVASHMEERGDDAECF